MSFFIGAAAIVLSTSLSGCAEYLKFTNTLPGEYNLSGVSKIALVGFNTLPNDPVRGVYSVDDSTRRIVEDMIATVFFKGRTYRVTDLDAENMISSSGSAGAIKLANRFDAVLYGRVWWKTSGEYKNIHPVVHTLEKWRNEKYMSGKNNDGKPIYSVAHLTETMTDVMAEHRYRALNATLMLSITLYRLNNRGEVEKIVEDFAVADQYYLLDNGSFSTIFIPHDAAKASRFEQIAAQGEDKGAKAEKAALEKAGYINDNQFAATIPTDLQSKIMLGQKLTAALGKKMTQSDIVVEVKRDFSINEELLNGMRNGQYADVRKKLVTEIRMGVGYGISNRIGSLSAYPQEDAGVQVAKDPKYFEKLKNAKDDKAKAEIEEDIAELVEDAVDDFEDQLYALAICEEACRQYDYALETYRSLLKVSADEKYARGISRCLASLNMAERLQDASKDAKKAAKKASLK